MSSCALCQSDFSPSHTKQIYCSLSCSNHARKGIIEAANRAKYAEAPTPCERCHTTLTYEQKKTGNKWCSRSCRASAVNSSRITKRARLPGACVHCGHETVGKNRFCSSDCRQESRSSKKKAEIDSGLVATRATIKRYLIVERGHACETCGTTVWCGQSAPLVLDHIDGNAGNNDPSNLRLLCHNCNAQTPTFTGRNMGFGRGARGLKKG